MIGRHLIKTWSSTQQSISLSSGEAEYYGMVKGASVALGVRSMLADLGVDLEIRLRTDASAAKGIASRRGLGKIRHIEVNQLWLQGKVANGEVTIIKVAGEKNVADALTKAVDGNKVVEHVTKTGGRFEEGRHELAPEVAKDEGREEEEGVKPRGGSEEENVQEEEENEERVTPLYIRGLSFLTYSGTTEGNWPMLPCWPC